MMDALVGRLNVTRRSLGAGLAALAALVLAIVLILNTGGGVDTGPSTGEGIAAVEVPETGENAAVHFEGGPPELLYLSGTALQRLTIPTVKDNNVGEVATLDVFASPGSDLIAYVEQQVTGLLSQPVLNFLDPNSGDVTVVEPGISPLWMANGERLAFLRPVTATKCTADGCDGKTSVVAMDPATGQQTVLTGPGRWSLLAWAGDRLLLADVKNPSTVLSYGLDGSALKLDVAASEVWDASPDGNWLVTVTDAGARLVPLEEGAIAGEGKAVPLEGRKLAEGAWSHDSTQVAAVTLSTSEAITKKGETAGTQKISEVVVFSPDEPKPLSVEQTFGATGRLLWSIDGDALVFSKVVNEKAGLLQSFYCPVDVKGECRLLTSWTEDFVLLRSE